MPHPGRAADDASRALEDMLHALDDERLELAHRLHDGPQQVMTAIRLVADGTRHALEEGDTERARRCIERLEQLAGDGAEQLRRLAGSLDPRDLVDALGMLVETLADDGLEASLTVEGTWPEGEAQRDAEIYQVARECCLDAARNGASSIAISLAAMPGSATLRVRCTGSERIGDGTMTLLEQRAARIGAWIEAGRGQPVLLELRAPAQ
jgi:signal transduction histidine kinase